MCGIFGILIGAGSNFPTQSVKPTVDHLFKLSESRGKEASGIAIMVGQSIYVLKEPIAASKLIKLDEYKRIFSGVIKNEGYSEDNLKNPLAIFGHSRLVTTGESELNSNNQPVIKDGAVGVHNGIIVNDLDLWKSFPTLEKRYDVDTEVFLSLLQMFRKGNEPLINAVRNTFGFIQGSASVAVLFEDANLALLATNTGSLYTCTSKTGKLLVFASEKYILKQIVSTKSLSGLFDANTISQVKAGTGCVVNLRNLENQKFVLDGNPSNSTQTTSSITAKVKINVNINEISLPPAVTASTNNDPYSLKKSTKQSMMRIWERLYSGEINLKRCTKCLLPETMPYIRFDKEGVCNYCRNYEHRLEQRTNPLKGESALEEFVAKYKNTSGEPDCIVGFSGGRDSTFGLDYVKNVLKMNPIVFTYDWGMVNDLARRNQARVCGKLGVEQIVVSADIKRKRENIRKNLEAWLKKPDLGMVPLLMAGDKQFYYYFHKIREQTGAKLFIFCGGHEIEETPFKYGFCGVPHGVNTVMNSLTGISAINKLKLISYYAKHYLTNPAYINRSMLDTLFAYYCIYLLPDDYLYLYHYIEWDEKRVVSTIREKYDWEMATDTIATWRIDDGTAPFYNYIYLTMAGFTEFDNFRSYQIREGKLTREEAFELMKEENKPRFEAIEWYARAIGLDCNRAVGIINSAPKLWKDKR